MANILTFANQTITDANIFGGISYVADLNTGDEFSIGNTAAASVSFVTDVQLPLYTKDQTNGTFTWTRDSVARGRYYITEVTKAEGKYTVTAYDAMILLETSISALSISFPSSVSALAADIATYIGCTVSGTVINGTCTVDDLDETTSIRELLGYIAEASGCSVKIDGADHLCFMYYANSGITVTASEYKTLEVADYTCAKIDNVQIFDIAGMVCATAGSGTNTLFIQGNPFLYEATNTEALAIYNVVKDFAYAPVKCEMFVENGLEIGTIATFGTTPSLVMHLESSESGAVASSVGSDSRAELNKSIDVIINETAAIAKATNQYFWFTSTDTGAGAGAHITQETKVDFLTDPSSGGGNVLIDSSGMRIRDGLTPLSKFETTGVQIGQDNDGRITIDSDSIDVYTPENDLGMQITTLRDEYDRPVEVVAVGGQAGLDEQTPGHRVQLESSPGLWTALEAYAAQGQNVSFSIRANEWIPGEQRYEGVGNILFDHKDVKIVSENDVKISTGASGLASRNVIVDNGISCTDGGGYNLARGDGGVLQIGAYEQSNYGNCERVHINVRHHTDLGNTFQVLGRYVSGGSYTNYAYIRAGVDTTSEFIKLPPVYNRTVSGGRAMYAASDGTIGRSSSSERFKNSIRRLTEERQQKERERLLEGIRNISPAFFKFNEGHFGPDDGWNYDTDVLGFIAEDVAKAVPEAAVHNDENPELIDDWDMRQLVPALLLLAQEAMNRVEQLEKELEAIKRDK